MKLAFTALTALSLASTAMAQTTVQSCDRTVTFATPPKAAISNDVNLTEMMLALKLQDHMVGYTGISGWKTLDDKMTMGVEALPELSSKYPAKEVLIGADADFFFAGWNYGMRVGGEVTPQTLAPFGIAVYELTESCIHVGPKDAASMDDMYNDLRNLGAIFGVSVRAETLIEGYQSELAAFLDEQSALETAPRVFVYDSGEDVPFTAGQFAMPNALIEAAGGTNIMNDLDKSWATVGWEAVVDRNPEIVVIVNYGEVTADQKIEFMMSNPAFADIDAVRNKRFVVLEYVEATPGPRNIEAVKTLAAAFRAE
ncbi:Vitamin B12-binding protein [Ascidiaceihabitans donghaensis]|uniref:Vitamin B12-binding protein n=1 Tax=Ascidiaceihabitans donghaensis TaxID=1510460 RepID=A0A2R8B950_9RHOB|nr:ABC transporter substrate-binding protein [Ascidiaceihabitans donghaensis]SPH19611.1 Vitamin B12-binding protein [Ascidiaceihabitans donghaensis]